MPADAPSPRPSPTGAPMPPRPLARVEATGPKGRFLLWVDAVGGYLVCLDDRIVLGRAGPDSHADVPLMGDLSRNHATLAAQRRGLPAPGPSCLVRQRQAGCRPGRAPRRRRDPAGLDRRAGVPPAQPGQRHGAALDRQPAPASPGGRRRAPDGRDLHRRRGGRRPTSRPPRSRTRSSSIARPVRSGAAPPAPSTSTAEPVLPAPL